MIINGKEMTISSCSVLKMLEKLKLDSKIVVVEVNLDIVPAEEFESRILMEADKIEIIAFVGGG
ncbi:MAG: sulfur carrier protein ThiS [Sarcina sp.]